jgi:tetratricopeptide (TPR) repeat protein
VLARLIELYPGYTGAGNAYAAMAAVHRELKETAEERGVLEKLASIDGSAVDAYLRLMDLAAAGNDWPAVRRNAERMLAVNPLAPQPYRHLAKAAEALGDRDVAIRAYSTLLLMDPPDPAEVHFRLARLLRQAGKTDQARRHVLQSLEEAPRYRDAHRLLLEITRAASVNPKASPPASPKVQPTAPEASP